MTKSVNDQITDAVTQANTKVLGDAPAIALGALYQTASESAGIAMQNAVHAQNDLNTLTSAATTEGVSLLLSSQAAATEPAAAVVADILDQSEHVQATVAEALEKLRSSR